MEELILKKLTVEKIRPAYPYCARYRTKDAALTDSVRRHGVFVPLMVTRGDRPYVVAGHRRLHAARDSGQGTVPVLQLQPEKSPADLYLLALISNWRQAQTEMDFSWALHRAAREFGFTEKRLLEEVLPCLGLPQEIRVLRELEVLARLHAGIRGAVADGRISSRGARHLARLDAQDQGCLAENLIGRLWLTSNQWLQVSFWIYDILKRDRLTLSRLCEKTEVRNILDQDPVDPRLRGKKFVEALRAMRFPRHAEREKKLVQHTRSLNEDMAGIKVEIPQALEEEGYWLRARLDRPESVDRLLETVGRKKHLLNSLFDIML